MYDSEEEASATIHEEKYMNQFNISLMKISAFAIIIFIIALAFLTGCIAGPKGDTGPAGPVSNIPHYYDRFDPEFHSLVSTYESHRAMEIDMLGSMKMVAEIKVHRDGRLVPGVIGVCRKYRNGVRAIEIESSYWWGAHRIQSKALGYHELEHCIVDAPHTTTLNANGCPSIMNPYISSATTLIRCWDTMLDDLFDKGMNLNDADSCYIQPDKSTACYMEKRHDNIRHDSDLLLN